MTEDTGSANQVLSLPMVSRYWAMFLTSDFFLHTAISMRVVLQKCDWVSFYG